MTNEQSALTGGEILVQTLRVHGVDRVFCVPGESYLAVLDALVDAPDITITVCRQEGGAAMMAEAYGKCTGKPGICFVTRGPGATNAMAGLHIGRQDSTPMIMFVGQVGRAMMEREAFQEIDYRRMCSEVSKWAAQIDDPARIPEMVGRAFYTAVGGRPGPVVLALPEDMLTEQAELAPARHYENPKTGVSDQTLADIRQRLAAAVRPFVIIGGGGWSSESCDDLRRFAEAWDLPVGVSFRCQGYFDTLHPNYAGDVGLGVNPALRAAIQNADVLLVVGPKLGESTTDGYSLLDIPLPQQTLIHIHADAGELGRVYQPTLAINADMSTVPAALASLQPPETCSWADRTRSINTAYEAWTQPPENPGDLQYGEIMAWLRDYLPAEAIVTNGAGNYAIWPNRFHYYRQYRSMLAPTSGSMGYAVPSAVGAKLVHPDRPVVAFTGDGDFLMTGQELATAVQYDARIIVILVNNSMYGTIRMHQEREYPGRESGTGLHNPDFTALAQAYGAYAERVTRTDEFEPAFQRAEAAGKPALLELMLDPEAIAPGKTLTQIRQTK